MSKHTPGPWEQVADSIKSRTADCVVVRLPAQTDRVGDESPEQIERWDADARLIAAAPELLEALEQIVEVNGPGRIYKLNELGMLVSTMLSIARAAIAKAKGEE